MSDFKRQYLTAKKVIAEIEAGEWIAIYGEYSNKCFDAINIKTDRKLWLANGAWFCDIEKRIGIGTNAFGWLFRHWVWHCGAKQLKRECERQHREKHDYPLS